MAQVWHTHLTTKAFGLSSRSLEAKELFSLFLYISSHNRIKKWMHNCIFWNQFYFFFKCFKPLLCFWSSDFPHVKTQIQAVLWHEYSSASTGFNHPLNWFSKSQSWLNFCLRHFLTFLWDRGATFSRVVAVTVVTHFYPKYKAST